MKTMDELMEAGEGEEQTNEGDMPSENMMENLKLKKILELQKTVLNKIINTSTQSKLATPDTEENAKAIINLKKFR